MKKTKKCDHCRKNINTRLMICPLCGGHQQDTRDPLKPLCPRCRKSLEIHTQDNEEYDICPDCGGLWLDSGEFRQATRKSNVYQDKALNSRYIRGPHKDVLKYIQCVRCSKIMNRKNFSRISGVIIDECSRHGVWLDPGELDKIRHFIADGGLERAQNKEIEKNRVELERLATKVDQTAFTLKLLHFWNFKRWLFG